MAGETGGSDLQKEERVCKVARRKMSNGVKAAAALMALGGWILLVIATASAFPFGASLWLSLGHAPLDALPQILPWRNAVWALAAGAGWLLLRKLRSRLEERLSAEAQRPSPEAIERRLRSGRLYQWFLIAVTSTMVLAAWIFHNALGYEQERFNQILLWLLGIQGFLTAGTIAFFAYGVDISGFFGRGTGRRRRG